MSTLPYTLSPGEWALLIYITSSPHDEAARAHERVRPYLSETARRVARALLEGGEDPLVVDEVAHVRGCVSRSTL